MKGDIYTIFVTHVHNCCRSSNGGGGGSDSTKSLPNKNSSPDFIVLAFSEVIFTLWRKWNSILRLD